MANQDSYKRTQVRMPLDVYDALVERAEQEATSLNSLIVRFVSSQLEMPIGDAPETKVSESKLEKIADDLEKLVEVLDAKLNIPENHSD